MPTSCIYIMVYAVTQELKGSTKVGAQVYTVSRNWKLLYLGFAYALIYGSLKTQLKYSLL